MSDADGVISLSVERIARTLRAPATSYWLRDALTTAMRRDPVDALNDAETLVDLLRAHLDEQIAKAAPDAER